jgi:hypothetical protein
MLHVIVGFNFGRTGVAPARYTGWHHAGTRHLLGCGTVQVVFGFTPR